jgi:hypothetical protein
MIVIEIDRYVRPNVIQRTSTLEERACDEMRRGQDDFRRECLSPAIVQLYSVRVIVDKAYSRASRTDFCVMTTRALKDAGKIQPCKGIDMFTSTPVSLQ